MYATHGLHASIMIGAHVHPHIDTQKLTNTALQQMDKYLSAAVWYFLPAHGTVTSFQIATKKFINSRHLKPSSFWIVINESLWILKILVHRTPALHLA